MNNAEITLILGPMFAQKTSMLKDELLMEKRRGMKIVVIWHTIDTRFGQEHPVTHDGIELDFAESFRCSHIQEFIDARGDEEFDVLAVEEGQFFDDLANGLSVLRPRCKSIIITGLNGNFRQEMFKSIADIIPIVDDIVYKKSICGTCKNRGAIYSILKQVKLGVSSDIIVGDEDLYTTACRDCK